MPSIVADRCGFVNHNRLSTVKGALVPLLPEAERRLVLTERMFPHESFARGRRCVMCPDKSGSPKLISCCLCHSWCHVPCSCQTHLGRICPCRVKDIGSWTPRERSWSRRTLIWRTMLLPTKPVMRADDRMVGHDVNYKLAHMFMD